MDAGSAPVRGVVAAGHPRVCEAAAILLRAGGNAFDAVAGAGFAASAAEPALTSLGGGGFLLAHGADGSCRLFDFFVDTPGRGVPPRELAPHFVPVTVRFPASEQVFNVGLGSVAVPGALKGLLEVQARLGRLPLADVVAPAARLAREGVELNRHQAYFLHLLEPIMTLTEAGRRIFGPQGRYLGEGERYANPELAAFLEELPRGAAREFYEGGLAARAARDMAEGQGLLTREDLARYRVVERRPLEVAYRGHRLLTNPPPSFGGSLLALSLSLLAEVDLTGTARGSATHLDTLARLMQEVDALRDEGRLALEGLPSERRHSALERVRRTSGGTTHVSVCDAEGNSASMTTSNGEGSGYLVPGTGVMLNNMLGEDDLHPQGFHASPPGERVASMMSPSLLLEGERVRLAIGSGGSKRIRSAMLQALSAVVDFGADLEDAIRSPRIHWDGGTLHVEPGFAPDEIGRLAERWRVNAWPECNVYFGGVNAASPDGQAAGDPRRGVAALRVD